VPTLVETGFPELTLGSWHGLYALTGTPLHIVDKLYATAIKVMKDRDVIERYWSGGAAR
jgi:tripartite-type tricarboxylate transporter receptor subunit TctC